MSTTTTTAAFGIEDELTIEAQIEKQTHPHRDESILRELYHGRGLTLEECADRLGCHVQTVIKWMDRHGIDRRDQAEATKKSDKMGRPRVGYAPFCTRKNGSEWWTDGAGHTTNVGVHQLTAIADGADPAEVFADDTDVHHRNGIPWDNRPDNLEVVTRSQHNRTHREAAYEYDDELGCEVLVTADAAEAGGE